jgi:Domain of unknown function (DUF5668)
MSTATRCHCHSCMIKGLMGPAVIITIGVLFLLNETQGGRYYFWNSWPVILLVIGAVQLGSALAPREGHIVPPVPGTVPPIPTPPQPPVVPPPPPYTAQEQ